LKLNLIICFKIFNLMVWRKYCKVGFRPYNSLLGIVLSIKFCNVYKGGCHMSLTFLALFYWLAHELNTPFWFLIQKFVHVKSCFFQLCFLNQWECWFWNMLQFFEIIGYVICICVTMHCEASVINRNCLCKCLAWGQFALI